MFFARWIVCSFCVLFFISSLKADECPQKDQSVSDLKQISCAITDLWMAMANKQLSKVIANTEFFVEYDKESNPIHTEVVVLRLGTELAKAHETYQEKNSAKKDYTFSVATYPAEVKEGTCRGSSTIQKRENPSQNGNAESSPMYSPIEGKEPRYFQLRKKEDGKLVVCEKSTLSQSERISLFCASDSECIESLPVSCNQLDQGKENARSACVFIKEAQSVTKKFLGAGSKANRSLEHKFCPEDCSFYTRTLQKVQKVQGTDQYCLENYLIIHCGPKSDTPSVLEGWKAGRKYNLNIREVDDFCEDFNATCYRAGQAEEEVVEVDLPEEELPEESFTESDDESTSAQPIDEILEEKVNYEFWRKLGEFLKSLHDKEQERDDP